MSRIRPMTHLASILTLLGVSALGAAWGADPSLALQSYQAVALGPIMAVVIGLAMLVALYQYVMGNKAAVIWILLGILFLMVVKTVVTTMMGGNALGGFVVASMRYPTLGWDSGPPLTDAFSPSARAGIENWAVLGLDMGGRFLAGLFQAGVVGIALVIVGLVLGWKIMVGHQGGAAVKFFLLAIVVALFCGVPTVAFTSSDPNGGAGNFIREQDGVLSTTASNNCALLPAMVIVGSNHLAEALATTLFRTAPTVNTSNRAYQASKSSAMDAGMLADYAMYAAACSAATQGMLDYNKQQQTEAGAGVAAGFGGNSQLPTWMDQLRQWRVNPTKTAFGFYTGLTWAQRTPLTPAWDAATAWVPLDGYAYLGDWSVPPMVQLPEAKAVVAPYSVKSAMAGSPPFVAYFTGSALNVGTFARPPGDLLNQVLSWGNLDWRIYHLPIAIRYTSDSDDVVEKTREKLIHDNVASNKIMLRYCTLPAKPIASVDVGAGVATGGTFDFQWPQSADNNVPTGAVVDPYSMTVALARASVDTHVFFVDCGDLIRERIRNFAVARCKSDTTWYSSDPNNWGCMVFHEFGRLDADPAFTKPAVGTASRTAFDNCVDAEHAFWDANYPGATPNATRFVGSAFPRGPAGQVTANGANVGWLRNVATSDLPNTNPYGDAVITRYNDLSAYTNGVLDTSGAFTDGTGKSTSSIVVDPVQASDLRTSVALYLSGIGIQNQLGNAITGAADAPAQDDPQSPGWDIKKIFVYAILLIPKLIYTLIAGLAWVFKEIIMLVVPIFIGVGLMVVHLLYPVFFVVALATGRVTLLLDWAKAVLWVSFWPVFYVISDRLIGSVTAWGIAGDGPAGGMGGSATILVAAGIALMAPALSMVLINPSMSALAGSVNSVYGAGMQVAGAATKIIAAVAAGIAVPLAGAAGAMAGKAVSATAAKAGAAASQMGGTVGQIGQGMSKAVEVAGSAAARGAQYMGRNADAMMKNATDFGGAMSESLGAHGFGQGMNSARAVAEGAGNAARDVSGRVVMGAAMAGARKHLKQEQAAFASGKTADGSAMEAAEMNLRQWQGMAEQGGVFGNWAQVAYGNYSKGDMTNREILAGARETQGRRASENAQQYRAKAEAATTPGERGEWLAKEREAASTALQSYGQAAAIHTERGDFQSASTALLAAGQAATRAGDSGAGGELMARAAHAGHLALAEAHKRGDQRSIQEARYTNAAISQGRAENYLEQAQRMHAGSIVQNDTLAAAVHEAGKAQTGFAVVQNQAQEDLLSGVGAAQNERMNAGAVSAQTKARLVDAVSRLSQSRAASVELEAGGADPLVTAIPGGTGKFSSKVPAVDAKLMGDLRSAMDHANDGAASGQGYTMEGAMIAAAITPSGLPNPSAKSVPIMVLAAARDHEAGQGGQAAAERVQVIDQVTAGIRNSTNAREMSDSLATGVGFQVKRRFLGRRQADGGGNQP